MANTTFTPLFGFANGYGPAIMDKLLKGQPNIQVGLSLFWKVRFSYTSLTDADTSQALDLNTIAGTGKEFPANVLIKNVFAYLHTTFDGGATSELTIQVGDTGDPNGLVLAKSIHEDATGVVGWQQFGYGVELFSTNTLGPRPEAAFVPEALMTSTGGNLNAHTSGNITLVFELLPIQVPVAA